MDKLVTVGGECFEAEFHGTQTAQDRDGVYYLFQLRDLSQKKRGDLLISLFRFGPDKHLVPDYESRIETVRLNFIRHAFDAEKMSFERPNEPHRYQTLSLKLVDFKVPLAVSEEQIRQYVLHKAYWIGYRLGSVANKLLVRFDEALDLDYMGVTADDIKRVLWLLSGQGLIGKSEYPGCGIPTPGFVRDYESKGTKAYSKAPADDLPSSAQPMDELLGIPLRGQLERDLHKFAANRDGSPLSVLFVDLDKFKPVNDTYGHEMGDAVLKKIVSLIKPICRRKGEFYRRGGDEFVVVLPNYDVREAQAIAERLREAVSLASLENCPASVSASIGVASHPETTEEFNLLIKDADEAMYEAKRSGGNNVVVSKTPQPKPPEGARIAPRTMRDDGASKVEAAELWMSLEQGAHPNFIFRIENKSDDSVTLESIALKYGNVYLCKPTKPSKPEELELPPRSWKHVSSWAPSASPTTTLQMKLPDLHDGRIVEIDVVVVGIILGRKRTFTQSVLVTANYANQNITQFAG